MPLTALPTFTNRNRYSGSAMNRLSDALLEGFGWSVSPVFPFQSTLVVGTGAGLWTGYILHTANTFRYRYTQVGAGTTTIVMGGITILSSAVTGLRSGTINIAAYGFTTGTVYTVTLNTTAVTSVDVHWLGESVTSSYTAPPTFANGNILTPANLTTLRTGISEVQSCVEMPHAPFAFSKRGDPGPGNGEGCDGTGESLMVWRGSIYHTHNTLVYWFRHGSGVKKVGTRIYVNAVLVKEVEVNTRDSGSVTGTVALAALTRGTIYPMYVTVELDGTTARDRVFCHLYELSEISNNTCTPPPVWAHGGTNISATNLNRYSTIINAIHPAAAAPTSPLYYEQPAVKRLNTKAMIQRRRRWLRYVWSGSNVPQLFYGPQAAFQATLKSVAGNQYYDLDQVPNMVIGSYYLIDDVYYAQETDTPE